MQVLGDRYSRACDSRPNILANDSTYNHSSPPESREFMQLTTVNDRLLGHQDAPLSARLNGAGIEAGLCTCHLPTCQNGLDKPGFMLPEYAKGGIGVYFMLYEMEGMEKRIPQDKRIVGAAVDRFAGVGGTVEEWMDQLVRADKAVCARFGITQKAVFVNDTTGSLELHVMTGDQKGVQARWIKGVGWFSW